MPHIVASRDSVIKRYREIEMTIPQDFSPLPNSAIDQDHHVLTSVILRTRQHLETNHFPATNIGKNIQWLPCHAIDLAQDGDLDAHVDSVKFSGGVVCGISLLSDSIMRLRPSREPPENGNQLGQPHQQSCSSPDANDYIDLYLPKNSLYVLSGLSRYEYTHELLPSRSEFTLVKDGEYNVDVITVERGRRLSIIFRDKHPDSYT